MSMIEETIVLKDTKVYYKIIYSYNQILIFLLVRRNKQIFNT